MGLRLFLEFQVATMKTIQVLLHGISLLSTTASILDRDQETYTPVGTVDFRAR